MEPTQPRLRARSLSDSDERGRPQPAKLIGTEGSKRATMPRAVSAMDMHHLTTKEDPDEDPEEEWRNIAREQIDRETIRDLAKFFRSTGPPGTNNNAPVENCFGMSGTGDYRRWSIKSLRKTKRTPVINFRDSTELKTTAAGHSYKEISIPPAYGIIRSRASFQSRLSMLQQSHIAPIINPSDGEPPKQRALGVTGSPTSPTGSRTQSLAADNRKSGRSSRAGDVAAIVSRSSSRKDKNPYKMSIRVSTAEPGVRSFLRLVDEWLEEQEPDAEVAESIRERHTTASRHKLNQSIVSLLTPVQSDFGGGQEDVSKPKIQIDTAINSSSPEPVQCIPSRLPVTPPATESADENGFLGLSDDRPQTEPTSATSSRSPESKRQLSPFPNQRIRVGSPRSPKQQKKPANISVKRTLEVPETNLQPDSPGFPKMLAAMTFPSPPESIQSHSANNSISSMGMNRAVTTPPLSGRTTAMSSTPSNLDQRIMPPGRPPLRTYKSDGAANIAYMSQSSITSVAASESGYAEVSIAQATRYRTGMPTITDRRSFHKESVPANVESDRRLSRDSLRPEKQTQRQSSASTADSSRQSTNLSEHYRDSIRSDTSGTSDMTATTEVGKRHTGNRESVESAISHDDQQGMGNKRSGSISSAGTSGTATSLAERRMARRAKVREKLQRDIDTHKANLKLPRAPPGVGSLSDSVDSPVLGWFPNIGSAPRKAAVQTSSRLAQEASPPETPTTEEKPEHSVRRSSVHDITKLIPETVQEATTPVTPTHPTPSRCSFSPIMVEATEPAPRDKVSETPDNKPILTITPIMTVANIEARSPSASLRPLSLLVNGTSPPIVPPRSSRRPEVMTSMRQRPLPIRVAKNPLELTVSTDSKMKRNSSPLSPILPITPSLPSPRMSLPLGGFKPGSAPASTSSYATQVQSRRAEHSRQKLSLEDKETQWLTAHQRQTAEEWRLQALKERMRREQAEKSKLVDATNGFMDIPTAEGYDEEAESSNGDDERRKRLREKHTSSTLRFLNGNALSSAHTSWTRGGTPSMNSDDARTPTSDVSCEANLDVEKRLLKAILPLLESMNTTLKEMQRDSASRELSQKFMDTTMTLTSDALAKVQGRSLLERSEITSTRPMTSVQEEDVETDEAATVPA